MADDVVVRLQQPFPLAQPNITKLPMLQDVRTNAMTLIWETDGNGWNDGSSYPSEGLNLRHGKGAVIVSMDAHTEWITRPQYEEDLARGPGRLWCVPGNATGGR